MNKQMTGAYERYQRSTDYSLYDVYKSHSIYKEQAWDYCKNLMQEKGGHGLKVLGHNCMFFSAGFEYEEDGKKMFMYITHTADRCAEIQEAGK